MFKKSRSDFVSTSATDETEELVAVGDSQVAASPVVPHQTPFRAQRRILTGWGERFTNEIESWV
jgi:hypothetical protein